MCEEHTENYLRKPSNREQEKNERDKQRVNLNIGELDSSMKDLWLSDSGASNHMCNRESWFTDLNLYTSPRGCTVGNGERVQILGEGRVEVVSSVDGKEVTMILNEFLLILELPADSRGIDIKFREESANLYRMKPQ